MKSKFENLDLKIQILEIQIWKSRFGNPDLEIHLEIHLEIQI